MAEIPDSIGDWEHLLSSSPPPPPETTTTTSSDPFLSIFPPGNHEGLPAADNSDHHRPTPTKSAPATDNSGHRRSLCSRYPLVRWIRFALHLLSSKVAFFLSSARSRVLRFSFKFDSLVCVGGVIIGASSLMALGVWMWWRRRPRRSSGDTIERLNVLIREKDEKIIELLNQIAQLSNLLLARYRVRVVREC